MSLTVGSLTVADVRQPNVTLRSLVGAYELAFSVYATTTASREPTRIAILAGAEVTARLAGGARQLGFARPDVPIRIQTGEYTSTISSSLRLVLQPQQLFALDELRGDGDMNFDLQVIAEARDAQNLYQIQDTWYARVARSTWIEELRKCGAMDILLLEIPISPNATSNGLRAAQKHFVNGDYQSCVAQCRHVVQEVGQLKFGKADWANECLDRFAARRDMTKEEREAGVLAAFRHYTNQSHHTEGEGGVARYTRSEAYLLLTCSASLLAHWVKGAS